MINWVNKQSYFTVSLLVSIIFGFGIFIGAIASDVSLTDSIYAGLFLGSLSLIGFGIVKFTIPGTKAPSSDANLEN